MGVGRPVEESSLGLGSLLCNVGMVMESASQAGDGDSGGRRVITAGHRSVCAVQVSY